MLNCKHQDFMIDLETLATTPDAHILSIGVVDMNNTDHTFYHTVEGIGQKRTRDYSTLKWWMKQSKEAQEAATSRDHVLQIFDMLTQLSEFIATHKLTHPWSHGAIFDIVILENAYRQYNLPIPWNFWNVRDTRTLFDMVERMTGKTCKPLREGTYHNALDDALFQTQWVHAIRRIIEP